MQSFNLTEYLNHGVEHIVRGILKASVKNPRESLFMLEYAAASKKAASLRAESEEAGEHIPPFLIASITNRCNLHCKGCYARANASCNDQCGEELLTAWQWTDIFAQAASLGISFILLAGGEPFLRRDVLEAAGNFKNILFPVFTNGTMMDESYGRFFATKRNLIPILSIEGNLTATDERRGQGVFASLCQTMSMLSQKGVLFGASVTVTSKNLQEVTSESFTRDLMNRGCRAVIYVEYVPVDGKTKALAPNDEDRSQMAGRLMWLRQNLSDMVFISFPGDEKASGGCLAAGRGFFHINARGGAEPCPFSPYSDTNLLHTTLRDALQSPLFRRLNAEGLLTGEHTGGCVLFEQEQQVKLCL